jgi:YhcH/YjgK/YiaL family protein
MILDTIANAERYVALHPLFSQAFDFMRNNDLNTLAPGRHSILGTELFAIVEHVSGRTREAAQLECHRKYIDIQLILHGVDEMGWKPLADCLKPMSDYNAQADIQFFYDYPASWISTPAESFCIFFPEDTHAPLVSADHIHKIVLKIAV